MRDMIYLPLARRQMSYRGHVECIQENVLFGSAIAGVSFGHDNYREKFQVDSKLLLYLFIIPQIS
jgi:hypothetical protein